MNFKTLPTTKDFLNAYKRDRLIDGHLDSHLNDLEQYNKNYSTEISIFIRNQREQNMRNGGVSVISIHYLLFRHDLNPVVPPFDVDLSGWKNIIQSILLDEFRYSYAPLCIDKATNAETRTNYLFVIVQFLLNKFSVELNGNVVCFSHLDKELQQEFLFTSIPTYYKE